MVLWTFIISVAMGTQSLVRAKVRVRCEEKLDVAVQKCKALGSDLATHETLHVLSSSNSLKMPPTNLLWLPIKRKHFTEWITIDNKRYAKEVFPVSKRTVPEDCAVLRSEDGFVDEISCSKITRGYACHDERERCFSDGECFHTQGHNITFYCQPVTWYDAMRECASKGSKLLALHKEKIDRIAREAKEKLGSKGHFAIGIIRSGWYSIAGNDHEDIIKFYHWDTGEPKSESDCVVFVSATNKWKSVTCQDTHEYICMQNAKAIVPPETNIIRKYATETSLFLEISNLNSTNSVKDQAQDVSNNKETAQGYVSIAIISTGFLLLLLLLIVIILYLVKRFKRLETKMTCAEAKMREIHTEFSKAVENTIGNKRTSSLSLEESTKGSADGNEEENKEDAPEESLPLVDIKTKMIASPRHSNRET